MTLRYRLELRLTASDVGQRVVLRWRRPGEADREEVADVLGILEAAGQDSFRIRKLNGEIVVIPGRVPSAARPYRLRPDDAAPAAPGM